MKVRFILRLTLFGMVVSTLFIQSSDLINSPTSAQGWTESIYAHYFEQSNPLDNLQGVIKVSQQAINVLGKYIKDNSKNLANQSDKVILHALEIIEQKYMIFAMAVGEIEQNGLIDKWRNNKIAAQQLSNQIRKITEIPQGACTLVFGSTPLQKLKKEFSTLPRKKNAIQVLEYLTLFIVNASKAIEAAHLKLTTGQNYTVQKGC